MPGDSQQRSCQHETCEPCGIIQLRDAGRKDAQDKQQANAGTHKGSTPILYFKEKKRRFLSTIVWHFRSPSGLYAIV